MLCKYDINIPLSVRHVIVHESVEDDKTALCK